jgi:hypothetical protein
LFVLVVQRYDGLFSSQIVGPINCTWSKNYADFQQEKNCTAYHFVKADGMQDGRE